MLLILVPLLITEVIGYHSIDVHGENDGTCGVTGLPLLWLLIGLGKGVLTIVTIGLSITIFCTKIRNKERPERSIQTEEKLMAAKEAEAKLQPSNYFLVPNHKPSVSPPTQRSNEQKKTSH
ncbi:hypothetical protein M3Y98_01227200 [Aphelenchoides besseyi]|nr:hypothetical protein M3Y98_01227200 [Aphelenchoides besseyi]